MLASQSKQLGHFRLFGKFDEIAEGPRLLALMSSR